MARQWILTGQEGFDTSLEYQQDVPVPAATELSPNEVLVKLHAASLNYRELVIAGPIGVNGPITPPVVPGCDGAGVVVAVGSSVKEFREGDRVATHLGPKDDGAQPDDAPLTFAGVATALGQGTDGTLRSFGVFTEKSLVHVPKTLSWLPAATLTCTWVTAWNALFGIKGQELQPGGWVLVQGTGGVSIAALQLAVASGANVVATTSSEERASRLKTLGASHVVNYRTSPDTWGREARDLTTGARGFDFVVDIGGNETLPHSLAAVRPDGIVLVIGGVGDTAGTVPMSAALIHTCIVRGILAGSRDQFKALVRFIDERGIQPAVDDVVFELADVKEAYRRLKEKKHFSKVLVRIEHPE
ncbi:hypothetical protein ACHAQA_004932 [Verticillium albo-atrum]